MQAPPRSSWTRKWSFWQRSIVPGGTRRVDAEIGIDCQRWMRFYGRVSAFVKLSEMSNSLTSQGKLSRTAIVQGGCRCRGRIAFWIGSACLAWRLLLLLGILTESLEAASLALRGRYSIPFHSYEMLFDPGRNAAYVGDYLGHRLVKVSLTDGTILSEIALPNGPVYGTLSPNRERLYIGLWSSNREPNTSSVAEVDLNAWKATAMVPVSASPSFMAATDNRLFIISSIGDPFSTLQCYSAESGKLLDTHRSFNGGLGARLIMDPYQSTLYSVPVDFSFGAPCLVLRRFNAATGDLSYPTTFFEDKTLYCLDGFLEGLSQAWFLPGRSQLLLNSGHVLDVGGDPVDLSFRTRLDPAPFTFAALDSPNKSILTVTIDSPMRITQFHMETLSAGARFDVTNAGQYYWTVAAGQSFWLGGVSDETTFLEQYDNPASGGATNRPPVARFTTAPAAPTSTNSVRFDGSNSTDENTAAEGLAYRWDWDHDGVFDTDWTNAPTVTHHFNLSGTNHVSLQVRDRFGLIGQTTVDVVVTFATDPGVAPGASDEPFILPFAATGVAFNPIAPKLYAMEYASKRLAVMNLTNGLLEREFSFDFSPAAIAVSPDGSSMFVWLAGAQGTNGYIAEFVTEPISKVAEWPVDMASGLISATDSRILVALGQVGPQTCVRAFSGLSQSGANCVPLSFGPAGLAVNRAGDQLYVADEYYESKSTWRATIDGSGQIGTPEVLGAECGTGRFLVLPSNGWIVRGSGVICTPDFKAVTNLNHSPISFSADRLGDAFITVEGLTRLHAYQQSSATEIGSYELERSPISVGCQSGWVYGVSTFPEGTFIERRRLPSVDAAHDLPPEVTSLSPPNGVLVQDGSPLTVSFHAVDLDGTVTNTTLFVDGTPLQNLDAQPALWVATPPGVHRLQAVATDNWGLSSTSSVVEVMVNFPPTISLISPAPDAQLILPAPVTLIADAADVDGRIARVDFYRAGVLLVSATNAPFAASILETNRGAVVYSAIATDDTGAQASSLEVTVVFIGLPGDDILEAFELGSISQYATNVSNLTATREKLEPLHSGKGGNHSLWWRWTAPAEGWVYVSTFGSSFDTLLGAYAGPANASSPYAHLKTIASNDDNPAAPPSSQIKFGVVAGGQYLFAVDGYGEAAGEVAFSLVFSATQIVANDHLRNAVAWSGTTNFAVVNNSTATLEPGEPAHAGNKGGRSVWWSWYQTFPGELTLTTEGSTFDTILGIYVQSDPGSPTVSGLTEVASNDDASGKTRTSLLRFPSQAWQTYFIAVDGYDGAIGDIHLSLGWQPSPAPPSNDDFGNAIRIAGLRIALTASNIGATRQGDEQPHAGKEGGSSVWWSWKAPASGRVTVSTKGSNFDTLLAVYNGEDFSSLRQVAASDDDPLNPPSSVVRFDANAGATYSIAVDGFQGATGAISLSLESQATPAAILLSVEVFRSLCRLQVLAETASRLVVEHSTNLLDWSAVSTNQVSAGTNLLSVPITPNGSKEFFRASLKP